MNQEFSFTQCSIQNYHIRFALRSIVCSCWLINVISFNLH